MINLVVESRTVSENKLQKKQTKTTENQKKHQKIPNSVRDSTGEFLEINKQLLFGLFEVNKVIYLDLFFLPLI